MSAGIEKDLPELGERAEDGPWILARFADGEGAVLGHVGKKHGAADGIVGQTHQIAASAEQSVARGDESGGESEGAVGLTLLVVRNILLDGPDLRADAPAIGEARRGKRPLTRIGIEVLCSFAFFLGPLLFGDAEVGVGVDEAGIGDQSRPVDAFGLRRDTDVRPDGGDSTIDHDDRARLDRRTGPRDDLHARKCYGRLKVGPRRATDERG